MTRSSPSQTTPSREYSVAGVTCSHCVSSVREGPSEIAGVQVVDIDLASGQLTVVGDGVFDEAVRTAVADAGHKVVS